MRRARIGVAAIFTLALASCLDFDAALELCRSDGGCAVLVASDGGGDAGDASVVDSGSDGGAGGGSACTPPPGGPPAPTGVTDPNTGFTWLNPTPEGNALHAIWFGSGVYYAA